MTKSTSRKVQCISCGEQYFAKRGHECNIAQVKRGFSVSEPQKAKSRKLMYGRSK